MRFAIDPNKKIASAGYADPMVLRAATALYVGRAYPGEQIMVSALPIRGPGETVAEIGARLAGKLAPEAADLAVDTALDPKAANLRDVEQYHAAAVLYAWREYCWADLDTGASALAYSAGEAVQDYVDAEAAEFGISAVDDYTRSGVARDGTYVLTKSL